MDTSKEYIEMCRKAEEIQAQRMVDVDNYDSNYLDGDFGYSHKEKVEVFHRWYISESLTHEELSEWVWLPRQDQLQEMIFEGFSYVNKSATLQFSYLSDVIVKKESGFEDYYLQFAEFEQLLLAIIMKIKFNKTWTGTEWQTN